MDFTAIIVKFTGQILGFAQASPFIALAVLLVLAYFVYRKPAFSFFVLMLLLILAGVLYLIISMANPGVSEKEKLIHRGSEPENSFKLPGMML